MINILLVDDHDLVRAGLKRLLSDVRGMKVVGEVASGEKALEFVQENASTNKNVDVVLMDLAMPGIGGLEATKRLIRISPETRVIIVTVHAEAPMPSNLLKAGASGYLTKGCAFEEIKYAINEVMKGARYVDSEISRQLALSMLPGGDKSPMSNLSERELQIMIMVTQGLGSQEISDRLCLSPKTVSTYRTRLFEKLGVSNDVELTHLAARHGLTEK